MKNKSLDALGGRFAATWAELDSSCGSGKLQCASRCDTLDGPKRLRREKLTERLTEHEFCSDGAGSLNYAMRWKPRVGRILSL